MFLPFSLTLRFGLIALFVWVVSTSRPTHGVVLLGFLAGLCVLSLFSDNKFKRWWMIPDEPSVIQVPNHDGTAPDMKCHVGMPDQFEEHFADILAEESIQMAAIKHMNSGQIWAVEQPGRHSHVMWAMHMLSVPSHLQGDQGFLTSYGRYVDRKEAALIAAAANQLLDKQHTPTSLFSEDVWATPPWPGMEEQTGVSA